MLVVYCLLSSTLVLTHAASLKGKPINANGGLSMYISLHDPSSKKKLSFNTGFLISKSF